MVNAGDYSFSLGYYISGCTTTNSSNTNFPYILLSLTKGQLAASVVMLVSCLVFVAIYIYVYITALMDERAGLNKKFLPNNQRLPIPDPIAGLPQQPWTSGAPQAVSYSPASMDIGSNTIRSHDGSQTVLSPSCHTKFKVLDRF
ncbi:unnamed protein product [Rotaria sp. Silwood1]|nr:unnamed protein product [Rotaria sp. Silwood1]CAF1660434.1 unnamed protein product [Rotaria sp. Silwood1]CAF3878606.1 unnamed protein product [Rotaria sp. Silwood1]CAF3892775.1 unnamed protein product [Rotaria sp. Silwood1]CAF3896879.1 unnamed protein product [Rotaria sp. Silwood1]